MTKYGSVKILSYLLLKRKETCNLWKFRWKCRMMWKWRQES